MNKDMKRKLQFYKDTVEAYIEDYFASLKGVPKSLSDSMLYSISAGGKRLRPALLMGAYEVFAGEGLQDAVAFAASIEMIHTYSLIHDDLPAMDDDAIRRGKPSSHMVFGEAGAILAGDALLNCAVENILSAVTAGNETKKLKAARIIMKAAGVSGMIGGQVLDMEGAADSESLAHMHSLKTGALFNAAVLAGGILGDCKADDEKYLHEYSSNLGCAFQIKDDILDMISTDEVLGKPTGSDSRNDKVTYAALYGVDKSNMLLDQKIEKALMALEEIKGDTVFLADVARYVRDRKN